MTARKPAGTEERRGGETFTVTLTYFFILRKGLGYNSVVECLLSICEALGSILNNKNHKATNYWFKLHKI